MIEHNQQPSIPCPTCGGQSDAPTRWGMSWIDRKCKVCGLAFSSVALSRDRRVGHSMTIGPTSSGKTTFNFLKSGKN